IADRAIAAAGAVRMPPFTVALDRVGSWGRGVGQRAIVMWADDGVIGVRLLHAAIHEALAAAGSVRGPEPGLEPHLTLWRDKAEAPLEFVEPISWRIEAFVLLDSVWGEGRHEVLGRWPLLG
ncbi:MAG: 2-5 ligase, partial [Phenylobacterium sp.]|nr:2-5 ligase [Phenylobacterium sp.]